MRDELEDVLDLYEGMPPEGQQHWRQRSLPSVKFHSEAEQQEFMAELKQRDKQAPRPEGEPSSPALERSRTARSFKPGQHVKVNLAGLSKGGVRFSQNVAAVYAMVDAQISGDPPVYRVKLLISFRGISEVDLPAGRILPM